MTQEQQQGRPDGASRDGLAAVALIAITAIAIAFILYQII